MSPSPQLAPPGSSTYSSDTMSVGDGTWDSSRNSFLLPNLMGLNFDTMVYNGMGNRFRDMPGYQSLIRAHGIIAAIVFLGIIPSAIMVARFYNRSPRAALRYHIWAQILTLLLVTVVFALGWVAVGQPRSLTNPHHGIGLTLFLFVLVQVFGGAFIHRREKGRDRIRIPLKLYIHQWFGRSIALLGIAQVALGLTLYGSPQVLFILYALWVFGLLLAYFTLSYKYRRTFPQDYDDGDTYISSYRSERSDRPPPRRRSSHGLRNLATLGAAGAGIAALRRRSRSRRRYRDERGDDVVSSRRTSRSRRRSDSYRDEKYSEHDRDRRDHTWRNRILGGVATAGAVATVRNLLNRRRDRDRDSDIGEYGPPTGGAQSITQTDVSRVEHGHAPESPANDRWRRGGGRGPAPVPPNEDWRRVEEQEALQAATMSAASTGRPRPRTSERQDASVSAGSPRRPRSRPRRSGDSISSRSSYLSASPERPAPRRDYGIMEGLTALGVAGFVRHKFNQRRDRRDEERVAAMREKEIEDERRARRESQRRRYTGDGVPRRGSHRQSDLASSVGLTGSTPELSRHNPPLPGPPRDPPPVASGAPLSPSIPPSPNLPPPPPLGTYHDSSGSEAYTSAGGTRRHRHRAGRAGAAAATAASAAVAADAAAGASNDRLRHHRDSSRRRSSVDDSVASPPVSVKVKIHNDGRQVTLRRLNEEEAAAEREAKRRERRHNRNGSLSSQSGVGNDRWRRVEAQEAAQAQQMAGPATPSTRPMASSHGPADELHLPPPPPIPASSGMGGTVTPPGTNPYDTGTDVNSYASNRRRRRAERAVAKQAKGGSGSRVEFT